MERILGIVAKLEQRPNVYSKNHLVRYAQTLEAIDTNLIARGAALEIGYTSLFQFALSRQLGFRRVFGTDINLNVGNVEMRRQAIEDGLATEIIKLNIEHDVFPLADESLDFILCCEVIEHMEVDPMFPMMEFNRMLKKGGYIFMSTPNSTSYAMVAKVINGFRPHFYMQYRRDRGLYRHNFEHDRHSLSGLTKAAGFETVELKAVDVFKPPHPEGVSYCERLGLSKEFRGDCLFYLGRKVSGVIERYPREIYVP